MLKPFIKWAGGKTQLLNEITNLLPKQFNTYYEPFIGGGAVLFALQPVNAVINDINPALTNCYQKLKENVDVLIASLEILQRTSTVIDPKQFYYNVRNDYNLNLNTNSYMQAARFIYLNKHCFNGLYRVNSKGEFNVPFNANLKFECYNKEQLKQISKYLQNVEIKTGDFAKCVSNSTAGDFIFFDSPYVPLTATSFVDYTKDGFSYENHIRLAELFKELTAKGIYCMLTNHSTELIYNLYSDYNIKEVNVHRNINSNGKNRIGTEVIITNY